MILPKAFHPQDRQWIEEKLTEINSIAHPMLSNTVAIRYSEAYNEKLQDNKRNENKARREANTRLRVYVESLKAKTIAPPSR
jgi:hypothetical protein